MSSLSDTLLGLVIGYGAPFLGLFLFLGAMGIPFPTSLLVIAAGAFVRQGFINLWQGAVIALVGAVAGDSLSFGIGRVGENWLEARYGAHPAWMRAGAVFDRYGGFTVYITRFLLTAIAIPVNLIAGAAGYPFRRFIFFSITGEMTWILLYGGLGYWFGSQWETISTLIGDFSGLILGIVLLAGALYLALRQSPRGIKSRR